MASLLKNDKSESLKAPVNDISPPFNIEAEQEILGALLVKNDLIYSLPEITEDAFFEPVHRRIFSTFMDFITKGKVASPITMKPHFEQDTALKDIGGARYLIKLAAASIQVINAPDIALYLMDLQGRRSIIDACLTTIQKATDPKNHVAPGELLADISLALDDMSGRAARFKIRSEKEITQQLYDRMKTKTSVKKYSTGLPRLDAAMGGGMFINKLYGVRGRKKYGKTMLAGTISNNLMAARIPHIYLALEMGGDEIHQRSMAAKIGCYESDFRNGLQSDEYLTRLANYAASAGNYRYYLDAPGMKFDDLRALLPMLIRRYKADIFILDSLQLVGGKKHGESKVDHQDNVSQWLADAVKKYPVTGLVTMQENQDDNVRGGEGFLLACDQCYRLGKSDAGSNFAWLDMIETRYTGWQGVGKDGSPALRLSDNFTYYQEISSDTSPASGENFQLD